MQDFHSRKKNKENIFTHPIFSIFLFLILLLIINSVYKSYSKKRKIEIEHEKFINKYEALVERRNELRKKIDNLSTEDGIKEEIMKIYNVGEDGETVIHITEPKL